MMILRTILLGLLLMFRADASSKTLRNQWIQNIKSGLEKGHDLAHVFKQEKPFAIYHQINLLSNFLGSVDSFVAFLQGYDYMTDHGTYTNLKKTFVTVNDGIEQVPHKKFGSNFREIYLELRNIEFSYVLLNKFLGKVVEMSCTGTTDCKAKLEWTIQIFKKDFDIEEHYNHIVKATLNGTDSSDSILDKLTTSSNCDSAVLLDFGRNLFIKLFKAEQVVLVYRKLSGLGNSFDEIVEWSRDMYRIREKISVALRRCSKGNLTCNLDCEEGQCVKGAGHDMCFCPKFIDGKRCDIPNNVKLVNDASSIFSTLHSVDMMKDLTDMNQAQRLLMSSLECPLSAILSIENEMKSNVGEHTFSKPETGSFYRLFIDLNRVIQETRNSFRCTGLNNEVLFRPIFRLKKKLYTMDSLFRPNKGSFFRGRSLLGTFIDYNSDKACNSVYKKGVATLWRQFHLLQAISYITLMQLEQSEGKSTAASKLKYIDLVRKQVHFSKMESCQLDIPNSVHAHCGKYELLKSTQVYVHCQPGYARQGSNHTTCIQTKSSCKLCNCNNTGSSSKVCNPNTGQCDCKQEYHGLKCEHKRNRDCVWSSWTSWSACSRWCGYGGTQRRVRFHDVPKVGNGRACIGDYYGNRPCFVGCCQGTFRCTDWRRCDTNVRCQPCNCEKYGKSRYASCSDQTGKCTCMNGYYGDKCSDRDCIWGSWYKTSPDCALFTRTQKRSISRQREGNGRWCDPSGSIRCGY